MLRADVAERHARVGGAVCVQEPNIKEGVGGLRDLHAVLWVAQARHGSRGLADARAAGLLSEREHQAALRAYDFLLRVRAEAHFVTGRKTDVLTLDLQPAVAKSLGYEDSRGLLASELFMRDYYRRASDLHGVFRSVLRRPTGGGPPPLLRRPHEASPRPRLRGARRPAPRQVGGPPRQRPRAPLRLRRRPGRGCAALRRARPRGPRAPLPRGPRAARVEGGRRRLRRHPALARAGRARPARHARDGVPGPLPAGVRPGELPRPARLLPPLHGGRAHAARDRGDRRGGLGHGGRGAAVRPHPRRGRGRGPALPRDAAPRRRQGPRGRPLRAGGADGPAGVRPARARRAGHRGRGLPRRRPPRDVPDLAAPRPDRDQPRRLRSPSASEASTG